MMSVVPVMVVVPRIIGIHMVTPMTTVVAVVVLWIRAVPLPMMVVMSRRPPETYPHCERSLSSSLFLLTKTTYPKADCGAQVV